MLEADSPELVLSDEAEALARELAALTGETIEAAVERALEERLALDRAARGPTPLSE
jgi:hypothetical protein